MLSRCSGANARRHGGVLVQGRITGFWNGVLADKALGFQVQAAKRKLHLLIKDCQGEELIAVQ